MNDAMEGLAPVLFAVEDGIARITLNRPARLNAWTPDMHAELYKAFDIANADDGVRVVVLTGAGRAFCAGADIDEAFGRAAPLPAADRSWPELLRGSKPVIAAVNGAAVGIGLTMILPADYIVASTSARFSLAFVRLGLVMELASSRFLPARVGFGAASELALSGRTVDAREALSIGLVDRLVEDAALLAEADTVARQIARNPPEAVREAKRLLTLNANEPDLHKVLDRERTTLMRRLDSAEHKAAVEAFRRRKHQA